MADVYNIETMNSGNSGLLRLLTPTTANTSPSEHFLTRSANRCVKLNKNTDLPIGRETLTEALVRFLPFLGQSEIEMEERLLGLSQHNLPGNYVSVGKVTVDGKPLKQLLPKSRNKQLTSSAQLASDKGLSLTLMKMVTEAWMGKTTVPPAFLHSSPSHVRSLMFKDETSKEEFVVPAPVAFALGQCSCCLDNDFTTVVDNALFMQDLPISAVNKVIKDSVAVSAHNISLQELYSGFLSQGQEKDDTTLLHYLYSSERRMTRQTLFMPVLRLIIPKNLKKNQKNKSPRWAIGWHCIECVRALFGEEENRHLVARLSMISRRDDVIELLKEGGRKTDMRQLWNAQSTSRRNAKVQSDMRKIGDRKSLGRTNGNVPQLRKEELKELISEFVTHFGKKSPEVEANLFWHKASKSYRIATKSSLTKVRQIMNDTKEARAEQVSKITDLMAGLSLAPVTEIVQTTTTKDGGEEE